jgi:hypothetical protein
LAVAGTASEAFFRQEETPTSMPRSMASSPRYAPHGQQAMATLVGTLVGAVGSIPNRS